MREISLLEQIVTHLYLDAVELAEHLKEMVIEKSLNTHDANSIHAWAGNLHASATERVIPAFADNTNQKDRDERLEDFGIALKQLLDTLAFYAEDLPLAAQTFKKMKQRADCLEREFEKRQIPHRLGSDTEISIC